MKYSITIKEAKIEGDKFIAIVCAEDFDSGHWYEAIAVIFETTPLDMEICVEKAQEKAIEGLQKILENADNEN